MSFLTSYSKEYVQKIKLLSPYANPFSKIAMKWCDLIWSRKSPKFNLHHLRNISAGFKMAVLTPKSGIPLYFITTSDAMFLVSSLIKFHTFMHKKEMK